VRLWDASSGQELAVLRGHEGLVFPVAFSPDGSRIASGSGDKTVRLWDVSSGQELAVLRGHEGGVSSVAFSPDGSRIVSGSWDNTVRLWDASSGQELAVLRGSEDTVTSVAFSPDGSRIASGSWDGTVRLWDSVPYRDRVAQRDAAVGAENTISPLIDKLFSAGLCCPAVADQVRNDESLTDQLRHAAVNLVLKRCSEMREQARETHQQAQTYFDQGRFDEARPYMAELISIHKRAAQPQDAPAEAPNEYASLLLTCEPSDLRDPKVALPVALEANEMTDHEHPSYLDHYRLPTT